MIQILHRAAAAAAALTMAVTTPPAVAQQAPVPHPTEASNARDARLADLVRAWYFARLFDPDLEGSADKWDAALVGAVPAARAAADDAAFAGVVDAMLKTIGGSAMALDGPTPAAAPPAAVAPPASPPPAFRMEGGTVVASCVGIGRIGPAAAYNGAFAPVAAAVEAHGLVVDCRHLPLDATNYATSMAAKSWIDTLFASRLTGSLASGARRMRFHDGYPPDTGQSSGGYAQGNVLVELPPLLPVKGAPRAPATMPRLVLLVDPTGTDPADLAGGLQAAGRARVVAEGPPFDAGLYWLRLAHVAARIPTADYVYPDGRIGFRADACVNPGKDDEALHVAMTMLDPAMHGPACPPSSQAADAAPAPAAAAGGPDAAPPVGERVLALAKLWGTIDYFYPYKPLLDRPWEGQLEASLPAFLAADSRAAYEEAVQDLAHQIQDSHVGVGGQRASRMALRAWSPPLYVRPVGGGYAIVGLHDASLASRIHPGDEIVAVDGRPVAAIAAEIGAIASASTPQALARYVASALAAGPQGSDARLTLRRPGAPPFDVVVKRTLGAWAAGSRPADPRPAWRRLTPDIGYVDLERLKRDDADKAIDDLLGTKAIVFDLRGYPQGTAWIVAPRLALPGRDEAVAASFRRPHYVGPGGPTETFTSFDQRLPPTDKPHYKGKVIVLIDDRAISQSEHTALFFKAAGNPRFVGTPTTGANGDVTWVTLPGDLAVSFTGHDVRYPDGRQLQRVGIQPDVRAAPTLAGIRAGRDEVLEAGLRLARQGK
jgi:C-terminal processing protease CtpA/Prc